ncbi:MAG TPA: hypothetical protein VD884_10695 [Ohtaekwangia sp.]|nr:hypothetical protein [Ohtaekwangia sp.]
MMMQRIKRKLFLIVTPALFVLMDCSSDMNDDPIPYNAFEDIIVNLSLPTYFDLHADGNYKYINGGVKGIILYRVNSTTFRAFERTCSYEPNAACATVDVNITRAYMEDTCCNSTFNFDGEPLGGPAWRRLRQYETQIFGGQVIITDEVIE